MRQALYTVIVLSVIPAIATTGCGRSEDREPAVESDLLPNYRIAYNVNHDKAADDYEVFVMNLDGTGKRNVTENPAVDWAYVAEGEWLYMVSDRDDAPRKYHVYEIHVNGTGLRKITEFRVGDSWLGVDRERMNLYVSSSKDGTPDLYRVDRDGNLLRRLTNDEFRDSDPDLSPDERRLVWRSDRSGIDELWIMDLETGQQRQLTHYPQNTRPVHEHAYHVGPPLWEPTRDLISFCSNRNGGNSIYTIRPDGSGEVQITPDGMDQCYHSWSADGRFLAFDAEDEDGNFDVFLRDIQTGETTRLTDDPRYEGGPVFVGPAVEPALAAGTQPLK